MAMMMPTNNRGDRGRENGNAFFLVMIGVVLFAGLMFALSRGARQGGENITKKQAQIAATAILDYAQRMERGVNNVMRTVTFSEQDISFTNKFQSGVGYDNANCGSARCEVFSPSGGSISYVSPTDTMSDSNEWMISGNNTVPGIGVGSEADLLLIFDKVRVSVCTEINDRLGISTLPTDADGIETATFFTGTYTNSQQIGGATNSGLSAACVMNTTPDPDEYVFYYVLRAR